MAAQDFDVLYELDGDHSGISSCMDLCATGPSRRKMAKGWRCPQAQIDKADAFPEVVDRVREWLRGLDLVDEDEQLVDGVCWCTDGVRLRVRRLHTEADLTAPSPAAVGPPRFCKWLAVRGRNTH